MQPYFERKRDWVRNEVAGLGCAGLVAFSFVAEPYIQLMMYWCCVVPFIIVVTGSGRCPGRDLSTGRNFVNADPPLQFAMIARWTVIAW